MGRENRQQNTSESALTRAQIALSHIQPTRAKLLSPRGSSRRAAAEGLLKGNQRSQPREPKQLQHPELLTHSHLHPPPTSIPLPSPPPAPFPPFPGLPRAPSPLRGPGQSGAGMLPSARGSTCTGWLGSLIYIHYQLMQWNWLTMGEAAAKIQHAACRCPWERQALLEDLRGTKGYPRFASDATLAIQKPSLEEGAPSERKA